MICVISTSKLEIPEDGNDVLDDVLDAKQFWQKVYALSVGDFNMLTRLVIQITYISWNRSVKRKIIIFNYNLIKHLIEDHCTDQAQKAERVPSAVRLILSFLFIYFIYQCFIEL